MIEAKKRIKNGEIFQKNSLQILKNGRIFQDIVKKILREKNDTKIRIRNSEKCRESNYKMVGIWEFNNYQPHHYVPTPKNLSNATAAVFHKGLALLGRSHELLEEPLTGAMPAHTGLSPTPEACLSVEAGSEKAAGQYPPPTLQ